MANGQITRKTDREPLREDPPDCPQCASGALLVRRVVEHRPCGHVYFDGELDGDCPKCGDRPTADTIARRGTVETCTDCARIVDAAADGTTRGE